MAMRGGRQTPTQALAAGRRRATRALATLGEQLALARRRRHWTQRDLGQRVGLTQARISQIEAGRGGGVPTELWFALAEAVRLPLRFELGRDPLHELEDAGHLELQELLIGLARSAGFNATFELPTRTASPGLSVDVGIRDDTRRLMVIEECWNTFGNLGASVRNTRRKLVELEALAVAAGGEHGPYRTGACWVVRDVPRNLEVLDRYPQIFAATFTGDSGEWLRVLTRRGGLPPVDPGLVLCDPRRGRLRPWRPWRPWR